MNNKSMNPDRFNKREQLAIRALLSILPSSPAHITEHTTKIHVKQAFDIADEFLSLSAKEPVRLAAREPEHGIAVKPAAEEVWLLWREGVGDAGFVYLQRFQNPKCYYCMLGDAYDKDYWIMGEIKTPKNPIRLSSPPRTPDDALRMLRDYSQGSAAPAAKKWHLWKELVEWIGEEPVRVMYTQLVDNPAICWSCAERGAHKNSEWFPEPARKAPDNAIVLDELLNPSLAFARLNDVEEEEDDVPPKRSGGRKPQGPWHLWRDREDPAIAYAQCVSNPVFCWSCVADQHESREWVIGPVRDNVPAEAVEVEGLPSPQKAVGILEAKEQPLWVLWKDDGDGIYNSLHLQRADGTGNHYSYSYRAGNGQWQISKRTLTPTPRTAIRLDFIPEVEEASGIYTFPRRNDLWVCWREEGPGGDILRTQKSNDAKTSCWCRPDEWRKGWIYSRPMTPPEGAVVRDYPISPAAACNMLRKGG